MTYTSLILWTTTLWTAYALLMLTILSHRVTNRHLFLLTFTTSLVLWWAIAQLVAVHLALQAAAAALLLAAAAVALRALPRRTRKP